MLRRRDGLHTVTPKDWKVFIGFGGESGRACFVLFMKPESAVFRLESVYSIKRLRVRRNKAPGDFCFLKDSRGY